MPWMPGAAPSAVASRFWTSSTGFAWECWPEPCRKRSWPTFPGWSAPDATRWTTPGWPIEKISAEIFEIELRAEVELAKFARRD